MTFCNAIVLNKSVFNKDKNNYYCNIFLEKASYELSKNRSLYQIKMLYYDRTDVSEEIGVHRVSGSEAEILLV